MRDNIKTPMTLKTTDVYLGVGDMRRAADMREESASLYKLVHKGSNATADQWLAIGSRRRYEVECPFQRGRATSGLPQSTDIVRSARLVRFVAEANIAPARMT
jgi:hypothetical protein